MMLVLNQNSLVCFTCSIPHFALRTKVQVLLYPDHPETIIKYFVTYLKKRKHSIRSGHLVY